MILFGCSHYWNIRGFTAFDKKLTGDNTIKVLPETHPVLAEKIEKLHNIIVDQEIRIRNDIQKIISNPAMPSFKSPTQIISSLYSPAESSSNFLDISKNETQLPKMEIPRLFTAKNQSKISPEILPKPEISTSQEGATATDNLKRETNHFMQAQVFKYEKQSNITERRVANDELSKIHLPVFKNYNHRWYIIDFKDDFSYMYIPESDEFLSHHRLQKSAAQSNYKNKVVQLSMRKRSTFNCFVTPPSLSYLYMGPFSGDMKPPVVLLLSLQNGKVILRRRDHINPYGSVTTSFIVAVGENGIDCQYGRINSPVQQQEKVEEARIVSAPTVSVPIQPKVFKNLFDSSNKTTNIGHITIQKLSVQAGGVAKISIPQVESPSTSETMCSRQTISPHAQQHSNSFLRKCLSAAPKPITKTLSHLNSGLKISQVKSLREDDTPRGHTFKVHNRPGPVLVAPTMGSKSVEDNTEYGYYIAEHSTVPKIFAKKTEDAITLKTPSVDEINGSRIVRVKMESAVIRYLNE